MNERTTTFEIDDARASEVRQIILTVYALLKEKGYNPVAQISGYIMSEAPTCVTAYGNARIKMSQLNRAVDFS